MILRRTHVHTFEQLESRALLCTYHWGDPVAMQSLALAQAETVPQEPAPAATYLRRFNFQPDGSNPVPDYYRVDTGAPYGLRSNGLTYGWSADNRDGRDRDVLSDQRYDTFHHLQKNGANYSWEVLVPNGTYTVRVVAGDASYFDSVFKINVEGQLTVNATPTSSNRFAEGTRTVNITDGRITISNASGASNNKIAFVEIQSGPAPLPVVALSTSDSSAGEPGYTGSFTFTRSGDTSASLTVNYAVSGSASNGGDYELLSGVAIFAPGASSTTVEVHPIDDTVIEGTENVRIDLATAMHYSNAFNNTSASINISDNDSAPNPNLGTLTWTTKAANPTPRAEGYGAVVGGKFYTFGGYLNSQYRPSKIAHVYNPATNQWTQLNDAPLELTHAATANDDRYIYVAGGYPPGASGPTGPQAFASDKVFRYDTTNDTWISLPKLPFPRGSGQMQLVGRSLYFFGGSDAARSDKSNMWALNLDNQSLGWNSRASMPAARNHFGSATIDGKIYAVGGQTGQDAASVFKNNVYRYDPASNTWASVQSLTSARSHANASTFAHKGKIVIIGGETGPTTQLNKVEYYDPASNAWKSLTNLPRSVTAGIAGSFGDTIIFSTGAGGGFRGETWIGSFT